MSRQLSVLVLFFTFFTVAACQNNKEQNDSVENLVLKPAQFETKIAETQNATVLDVCTPNEFSQQHLRNAVNINYHSDNFKTAISQLDKQKPYFVYCWAGSRSAKAAELMRGLGFVKVYELDGGIANWMKNNKPVEKQ